MTEILIFDRDRLRVELDQFIRHAHALEKPETYAQAIQAWDTVLSTTCLTAYLAQAYVHLGKLYQEWDEVFTAQRFLRKAHRLEPDNETYESKLASLNRYIADHQVELLDERARKNSDLIVSLFRIATGLKLLKMDKPTQAYPLMKSRTKIYPNAAVARHLLGEIIITEDEKNSAIEYLEVRDWLENTGPDVYAITDKGLYAFYTELAKLHVTNEAYQDASVCYEQAYWLDDSSLAVLYDKLICDAKSEAWEAGLVLLDWLPDDPPENIDSLTYNSAVATICTLAYQANQDEATGQRAVTACETVLVTDKRNKEISNLLKTLQSEGFHPSDESTKTRKKWWRW